MSQDEDAKLEIDWLKTIAGALAAVSSAVALSTLGAAGTIIGAALGSVIATVGGALYGHGLTRSRKRLADAQTATLRKVGTAQAEVRRAGRSHDDRAADAHLAHADERLDEAKDDLDALAAETTEAGWQARLAGLPWRRVALIAAGVFAAAFLVITAFELVAGRSVSSITGGTDGDGGTTISRIGGGGDGARDDDPRRDDEGNREPEPTEPEEQEPTEEPTEEPSESPSEASPTPTPTPSAPDPSLPGDPTTSPSAG